MKVLLVILVLLVVSGSVYADYRWRKWVAARRQERDQDRDLRA
jgi:cell division protein FtsL